MQKLITFNLSLKNCKILDQMLVQAKGYPIKLIEDKLGYSKETLDNLFQKVRAIFENSSNKADVPLTLVFSKKEIIQMIRALAIAFIETGPNSDLSIVTGYSSNDVEDMYMELNKILIKSGI